jgi:hypothetical protein
MPVSTRMGRGVQENPNAPTADRLDCITVFAARALAEGKACDVGTRPRSPARPLLISRSPSKPVDAGPASGETAIPSSTGKQAYANAARKPNNDGRRSGGPAKRSGATRAAERRSAVPNEFGATGLGEVTDATDGSAVLGCLEILVEAEVAVAEPGK